MSKFFSTTIIVAIILILSASIYHSGKGRYQGIVVPSSTGRFTLHVVDTETGETTQSFLSY